MRTSRFARKKKLRVDLHGISVFGPGDQHTLIRWEWITDITVGTGVLVRSHNAEIRFTEGAFGLPPADLAALLRRARSIEYRGEVIGRLTQG